jgi:hypothetical protein
MLRDEIKKKINKGFKTKSTVIKIIKTKFDSINKDQTSLNFCSLIMFFIERREKRGGKEKCYNDNTHYTTIKKTTRCF